MTLRTNIVLVHGAWADGSIWSRVIPLLLDLDHNVTAVQIPLTSLADDAAVTRRVLRLQHGPTIVAGHSYGGMVISEAVADAPNVGCLVYISAFANEEGETLGELNARHVATSGPSPLRFGDPGFVWIDPEVFPEVFAHDLELTQARIMAAIQKPIAAKVFGEKPGRPAWKSLPSWYLISEVDRMLSPETQRFMADRISATTSAVPGSHASPISHATAAARMIAAAASSITMPAKAAMP